MVIMTGTAMFEDIKARQRQTWSSGDYTKVAWLTVPVAEQLVEAVGLRPGSRGGGGFAACAGTGGRGGRRRPPGRGGGGGGPPPPPRRSPGRPPVLPGHR